ncbi:hypothetical protein BSKO_01278 [Bryopsis sp. KO-2023]|nr:hypothetical protein BSKO_01278 [Bryopsis sp. KO-2023]
MMRQASRLTRNTPLQRHPMLCLLIVITCGVTYISLRSLSHMVERHGRRNVNLDEGVPLQTKGWQAVAELALEHVEQLSQGGNRPKGALFKKYLKHFEGTSALAGDTGAAGAPEYVQSPEDEANTVMDGQCLMLPHTDFVGDALVWGYGNKKESAGDCCAQCLNYKPKEGELGCNLWVYCGDEEACGSQYKDCWIKHLLHAEYTRPNRGPKVIFTAGLVNSRSIYETVVEQGMQSTPENDRKYHVVTTAQGSAVHWQARIHYYWYKKIKAECEAAGPCDMGGFTRILHSGKPDDLMDEIPTFVSDELPHDMIKNGKRGYIVINRPYAFTQWVKAANITEKYILMSEPDHVFRKPMPNFMRGENPAAYPFFYIEPARPLNAAIIARMLRPMTKYELDDQIYPIGNAPTMLRFDDMKRMAQPWLDLTLKIYHDEEAHKEWGWVQEMYAFSLTAFNLGLKNMTMVPNMMGQPPWDDALNVTSTTPFYLIHYTYGMDFALNGDFMPGKFGEWRFDKRVFANTPLTRITGIPEKMNNDLVRALMAAFNDAIDNIPCWEEYTKTGVVAPC